MYALKNIEKFVNDNADRLGDLAYGILIRAKELSSNGVISGGSVEEIMQNHALAREFHETVMGDPEHVAIGLEAIHSAVSV